jgi:hypothetical protein
MHHWASQTFYDSYSGDPPYLDPVNFNRSAFSGGQIAFIEDENISFYEAKLKEKYGPPVEVDREYLNMILDKKKLKVSLDINSEFSAGELSTIIGKLEGSFDCCDTYIYSGFNDVVYEGAAWCRRDISSKAAQLNPKGDNGSLFDTQNDVYFDGSSFPLDELAPFRWGIINPVSTRNGSRSLRPQMLPTVVWSAAHEGQQSDPETGELIIVPLDNYSTSNSNELSGNYTFNASVYSDYYAAAAVGCAVGFIVVTPTKVYAFPNVNGFLLADDNAIGVLFTSVETDTYPALNLEGYLIPISFPPYASSTMTFLGVEIPIYFYYPEGDSTGPTPETYEGLSLIGTSFDILVEEDY